MCFPCAKLSLIYWEAKMSVDAKTVQLSPEEMAAVRSHLQEVLSSEAFAGGHRAQRFLELVVEHALAGRIDCLRERMLGAEMFGRAIDYDTGNDSVVRVKASEVRRRLAQYYQSLPSLPAMHIELPAGSYAPLFHWAPAHALPANQPDNGHADPAAALKSGATGTAIVAAGRKGWAGRASLLTAYTALLVAITWAVAGRFDAARGQRRTSNPIWASIFDGKRNTYIVPADVGFDLLEDLSHSPMQLPDYLKAAYLEQPLKGVDAHISQGLRSQRLTSFVDAQIISTLAQLPDYDPQRSFLRFPRDLRLDDLKDANAIMIGSVGSNPWASLADTSAANFHIEYRQGREGAMIVNRNPLPGERSSYESHWNEPAHETFALITFMPNLDGGGRMLFLQGLDVAGTQAAAEALFHASIVAPALKNATHPDGSVGSFEILVRSTSINWNSTDAKVIATRIH